MNTVYAVLNGVAIAYPRKFQVRVAIMVVEVVVGVSQRTFRWIRTRSQAREVFIAQSTVPGELLNLAQLMSPTLNFFARIAL